MRLLTLLIIPLLALSAAACGHPTRQADSVSTIDASTAEVPTVTPKSRDTVFVYTRAAERLDATGHGRVVEEVVTHDLTQQREVAAFQIDLQNSRLFAAVAGSRVVTLTRSGITRCDLDGSSAEMLRSAGPEREIIEMAVSPDGTRVALTEERLANTRIPLGPQYRANTFIVVLDVETGEEVQEIPQSDPGFDGFRGQAGGLTWRDDGQALIVQGYFYSERPGGTAVVTLDGSVRTSRFDDWTKIAPTGRFAEHGRRLPSRLAGSTLSRAASNSMISTTIFLWHRSMMTICSSVRTTGRPTALPSFTPRHLLYPTLTIRSSRNLTLLPRAIIFFASMARRRS